MEGMFMQTQDGVEWLKRQFAQAEANQKKAKGAYKSTVYKVEVPEELVLTFAQYESAQVLNPATGRVAGSKRSPKEKPEQLKVPAGADVRVYRAPSNAGRGDTVAVFFLADEQVTFKCETDLVRRKM